jgi:hypothetical protein
MKLKFKITLLLLMLVNICIYAQGAYTLNGVVTSDGDSSPLPGVNIIVLNSTTGAQTDFDGNYSLQVQEGDVLEFSFVGHINQRVIIVSQQTVNVSLVEDTSLLDEVVVVGYGTQKKSHLTGAISKVVNENLDQIAVARVDDALIGQVSGVNITASNP